MDVSQATLDGSLRRVRPWRSPIGAGLASVYAIALISPISEFCPASYPNTCPPESRESIAVQSAVILLLVLAAGLLLLALIGSGRRDRASRWIAGLVVATGLALVGRTLLFTGFGWSPIPRFDGMVLVPLVLTAASAMIAVVGWTLENRIQSAPPVASRAMLRVGLVLVAAGAAWLLIWSFFFIQPSV